MRLNGVWYCISKSWWIPLPPTPTVGPLLFLSQLRRMMVAAPRRGIRWVQEMQVIDIISMHFHSTPFKKIVWIDYLAVVITMTMALNGDLLLRHLNQLLLILILLKRKPLILIPELPLHLNQPRVAPIKLKVQPPSTAQLPCLLLSLGGQGFHSSCTHQNYILTIWGRLLSCSNDRRLIHATHTHIKKRHDQNSSCWSLTMYSQSVNLVKLGYKSFAIVSIRLKVYDNETYINFRSIRLGVRRVL